MDNSEVVSRIKMNLANHLNPHVPFILLCPIGVVILYYFNFDKYVVQVFFIIWLIDLLPALYLHFRYWLKNKGEEYEINFDQLVRYKNGNKQVYKSREIETINIYMSPALYRGSNFHLLGIEAYHYARIYLKSGEELIITSLLTPKVEKTLRKLRGVKIERKKRLFCSPG